MFLVQVRGGRRRVGSSPGPAQPILCFPRPHGPCPLLELGHAHSAAALLPAGCPLLTTTGLSGLVQLQELEELELTNCPGATPELFKYFSQHLPRCLVIE